MAHQKVRQSVVFFAPRLHNNQRGWISALLASGATVTFIDFGAGTSESVDGIETITARRNFLSHLLYMKCVLTRHNKEPQEDIARKTFIPSVVWLAWFLIRQRPDVFIARDRTRASFTALVVASIARIPSLLIYEQVKLGSERSVPNPKLREENSRTLGSRFRDAVLRLFGLDSIQSISPLATSETLVALGTRGVEPDFKQGSFVPFLVDAAKRRSAHDYFPEGIVRICFVGKFRPYKNLGLLGKTFEALDRAQLQTVRLTVVGQAKSSQELNEKRLLESSLSRIRGLDFEVQSNLSYSEVQELLRRSDILIFPSSQDLAPITPLEAMSSGVVPLVSRTAGTACYVEAWNDHLILDPEATEEWVTALSDLIRQTAEICRLGMLAQEEASRLVNNRQVFLALLLSAVTKAKDRRK